MKNANFSANSRWLWQNWKVLMVSLPLTEYLAGVYLEGAGLFEKSASDHQSNHKELLGGAPSARSSFPASIHPAVREYATHFLALPLVKDSGLVQQKEKHSYIYPSRPNRVLLHYFYLYSTFTAFRNTAICFHWSNAAVEKKNTSQQVFVPWQVKAGNAERSMMGNWVLMGFEGFLLRFAEKGKMFRKRSNWGLNTSSCLCCSEGTSENSDWKLPLEWFLSYQHKTVTVYKCVRVHSGIHMCFFCT